MRFIMKNEIKGRMRIHVIQNNTMTYQEADTLVYYLHGLKTVTFVKVYDRTADAVIKFIGDRKLVIQAQKELRYDSVRVPLGVLDNSGRELNAKYQERLICKVLFRYLRKFLLPYPVRVLYTGIHAAKYLARGLQTLLKGRLLVPVLDAAAIGISVLRNDLNTAGSGRFEKIVTMIEESERLKSGLQGKAEHLADRLVPYTLGGTLLTYLLTGNATKALSVLMVDFSCALKLAMPIAVLSAIREASLYNISVKGGKFLETIAEADTIVFDKTGTLTKARPTVVKVVSFNGAEPDELLRTAACLEQKFEELSSEYTHLYLAVENSLAAVICIEDPLREEAEGVINSLKRSGIEKIVMMTGDSERTAGAIAEKVGVDQYYSEVLPEDKARFIQSEKEKGHKVIMIGDGINDSPALSAADVGIAISDGAEIAREIADITIDADNLFEIVTLKAISEGLMQRIQRNYRFIVSFNTGLLASGISGLLQPASSALLHNTSTLAIGLKSMQNLLT